MSNFFEKFSNTAKNLAQNAVEKGKDLAEITSINVDTGNAEEIIRNAEQAIGNYVVENNLLTDDLTVKAHVNDIVNAKERIKANNEKIEAIKAK